MKKCVLHGQVQDAECFEDRVWGTIHRKPDPHTLMGSRYIPDDGPDGPDHPMDVPQPGPPPPLPPPPG